MPRRAYPRDLRGEEWAVLAPLIPPAQPSERPRTTDRRDVLNAIFLPASQRGRVALPLTGVIRVADCIRLLPSLAERGAVGANLYDVTRMRAPPERACGGSLGGHYRFVVGQDYG